MKSAHAPLKCGEPITAGRGRVTAVQFDVAAAGKGFQRRTQRMEIRDDTGSLSWHTAGEVPDATTMLLRAAL